MPKQRAVLGLRPRRISFLLVLLGLFALFTLLFTLPSAIPTGPSLSKSIADHKFSIPKYKDKISSSILNPFRPASHKPPEQKNSTYGGSSWYSNWNWRSPFSSSITLDENRSLLPPLKDRAPIYCYYDTTVQRDKATGEADSALLLTWRRAWWAQGFKPIILSPAEAMNNPLYDELQRLEVEPGFKKDMMRWLAWENMGGGLLAHHLLLPMAAHEDPMLSFLRRGEYPGLTRWEGFDNALFAGPKIQIADAIIQALRTPQKKAKDFIAAVTGDTFRVDPSRDSLAFYDTKTIEKTYPKVAEAMAESREKGLKSLNLLINFHLHNTWQDAFSNGIAVLKPMPAHTTYMIEPAVDLATRLAACSDSPMPASCPPNLLKCSPCVSSHPMKIATPARYRNTTGLYTIGTVPHPYTLRTLDTQRETLDIAFVRREIKKRDEWLYLIFQELLGTGISGSVRVVKFKDAVAGDYATSHSLWLTPEREPMVPHDLDWWFGFAIPSNATDDGKSETPVPGPERRPKPQHDPADGPIPSDDELSREPRLLDRAREVFKSKGDTSDVRVRSAMEAWNLADTEAWRFARAFLARSRVERMKWEEEESRYAGGVGSDADNTGKSGSSSSSWLRWGDDED
ncbi:40S ribosomal protein S25 [Hypoxylon texense]